METLENVVLSPTFGIVLALFALLLFAVLLREFLLWFLKINRLEKEVKDLKTSVDLLQNQIDKLEEVKIMVTPPAKVRETSQFPLAH